MSRCSSPKKNRHLTGMWTGLAVSNGGN
ncbi:hypothetical protein LINPERPRIM_LOCUS14018 [Linum perenne]